MGDWLVEAASSYNRDSYEQREMYSTHLLMPIETLRTVIQWSMETIPDEVLIGFDPDPERPNPEHVERAFGPAQSTFSGHGFLLGEPRIVNVGDSFRGSRFSSFLHSHPKAYARPSQSDAEAADWTEGVEMILGVRFSPAPLGLEWFDDDDSHRRGLGSDTKGELETLAKVAGRSIHAFELIGYLRNGEGVNLLITDQVGDPIGIDLS